MSKEIELRDYLAGQALAAFIMRLTNQDMDKPKFTKTLAEISYKMADRMIEARKKESYI